MKQLNITQGTGASKKFVGEGVEFPNHVTVCWMPQLGGLMMFVTRVDRFRALRKLGCHVSWGSKLM